MKTFDKSDSFIAHVPSFSDVSGQKIVMPDASRDNMKFNQRMITLKIPGQVNVFGRKIKQSGFAQNYVGIYIRKDFLAPSCKKAQRAGNLKIGQAHVYF